MKSFVTSCPMGHAILTSYLPASIQDDESVSESKTVDIQSLWIDLGAVQEWNETLSKNTTVVPIVTKPDCAFTVETGTVRTISLKTVHMNSDASRFTPGDPYFTGDNIETTTNEQWMTALDNLASQWQMKIGGLVLEFIPYNDGETDLRMWKREKIHGMITDLSVDYEAGFPEKLTMNMEFAVGLSAYMPSEVRDIPLDLESTQSIDDEWYTFRESRSFSSFAISAMGQSGMAYNLLSASEENNLTTSYELSGGPEQPFESLTLKMARKRADIMYPQIMKDLKTGSSKISVQAVGSNNAMRLTQMKSDSSSITLTAYDTADVFKGLYLKNDLGITADDKPYMAPEDVLSQMLTDGSVGMVDGSGNDYHDRPIYVRESGRPNELIWLANGNHTRSNRYKYFYSTENALSALELNRRYSGAAEGDIAVDTYMFNMKEKSDVWNKDQAEGGPHRNLDVCGFRSMKVGNGWVDLGKNVIGFKAGTNVWSAMRACAQAMGESGKDQGSAVKIWFSGGKAYVADFGIYAKGSEGELRYTYVPVYNVGELYAEDPDLTESSLHENIYLTYGNGGGNTYSGTLGDTELTGDINPSGNVVVSLSGPFENWQLPNTVRVAAYMSGTDPVSGDVLTRYPLYANGEPADEIYLEKYIHYAFGYPNSDTANVQITLDDGLYDVLKELRGDRSWCSCGLELNVAYRKSGNSIGGLVIGQCDYDDNSTEYVRNSVLVPNRDGSTTKVFEKPSQSLYGEKSTDLTVPQGTVYNNASTHDMGRTVLNLTAYPQTAITFSVTEQRTTASALGVNSQDPATEWTATFPCACAASRISSDIDGQEVSHDRYTTGSGTPKIYPAQLALSKYVRRYPEFVTEYTFGMQANTDMTQTISKILSNQVRQ